MQRMRRLVVPAFAAVSFGTLGLVLANEWLAASRGVRGGAIDVSSEVAAIEPAADAPVSELVESNPTIQRVSATIEDERIELYPYLYSTPFGVEPQISPENTYRALGHAPSWEVVEERFHYYVRTGAHFSRKAFLKETRAVINPDAVETVISTRHPRYEIARPIIEHYEAIFDDFTEEYAEAELRYREAVVSKELYRKWQPGDPNPDLSGWSTSQMSFAYDAWHLYFSFEAGVCPEYDAARARVKELKDELYGQLWQIAHG